MPTFDFDKLTYRRGSLSCKWDVAEGELPMWVADMDFETAPAVRRAIEERAAHGIFGYTDVQEDYFRAYSDFWHRRHGYRFATEELIYAGGTVAAISSSVRRLTHPGESVLILAPVYNIFYNSILNNGRVVLSSDLLLVDGEWEINWADFEEKLARPRIKAYVQRQNARLRAVKGGREGRPKGQYGNLRPARYGKVADYRQYHNRRHLQAQARPRRFTEKGGA